MYSLTGQQKCQIHVMENVILTQKEQARLQVLNSLLAEHVTLDQAATLMGVTTRHTRRILAAYREEGAAAVAHGHRGRQPPNATPDAVVSDVVRLARTRYEGANHTHLSELLSEREGIDIGRTTLRRILVNAGLSSPRLRRPSKHRVRRQRMPRTELRLAGASSNGAANRVLEQFLPRFNRRFQVPPQHPEPAFRPLDPELCLDQILCFKHRRKVAKDNTVRFQLHTLQLLPGPERPSYAGAAVEVLEGLDGRLTVRPRRAHSGGATESGISPQRPRAAPVMSSGANGLGEHWTATLEPLDSRATDENGHGMITDGVARADKPQATSARKPTFLQRERWKAIQKARRKGISLRAIERELGIHRSTTRKYLDAEGPPTRQSRAGPTASSSDTIAA